MADDGTIHGAWPWQTGMLDPHGPIAAAERTILLDSTTIMLAVVVPVIVMTLGFAWWFRAGNHKARYLPDWSYSGHVELVVWAIPALVVMFLGGIAWIGSHKLDPYRSLDSTTPAMDVQVVALDWKWLFIYPGQGIATVNRLVIPVGTPIRFDLTSATVMNSFLVPQLGGQIYAMARMTTRLNLQADKTGRYPGLSAQFSGAGFSDMHFAVDAVSQDRFDAFVSTARESGDALDAAHYAQLAQRRTQPQPQTFRAVLPHLFQDVVSGRVPASDPANQDAADPGKTKQMAGH